MGSWFASISSDPSRFVPLGGGLLVLLAIVLVLRRWWRSRVRLERRPLLTKAELELLAILRAALPSRLIGCQVSMGALLQPRRGINRRAASLARNKISQKVVDFAVIDPATGFVEALIELDDSTHDARRDAARDRLLAQGRYRVIRIPSRPRPTAETVRPYLASLER
ncbi:DUF2726 domain-containing protein [Aureimonas jatrophae]|uniref:DUF2726 domain-containing protein n=1 Tax=Aureimonas jatrophae TaxID=1166073 RepID=A0A1H0L7L7_9HYPH|nr:DUF2726 domain-containing protein [Aureimonas jatrophae]MBB3952437.1 hypothetical protein [Aureimonas jatrophae]SDO64036.1 Protein of unknown function [Aureimonas jatrophae]